MTNSARDHADMEVLSSEEALGLLASVPVGRIAFVADGRPQIFPINYYIDGEHLVFRSALGSKLDAAEMGRRIAFEADQWNPNTFSGWSVVISGKARSITDPDRIAELEQLDFQPWLSSGEMGWVDVLIEEISGRRL